VCGVIVIRRVGWICYVCGVIVIRHVGVYMLRVWYNLCDTCCGARLTCVV
jgi:hypothetical protein